MKTTSLSLKTWAVAITLAGSTLTSCRDAIEVTPYSSFTGANFFSSVEEAKLATLGVYEPMKTPALYAWYVSMLYDCDSDQAFNSPGTTPDWRAIPHYLGIPQTNFFYETWSTYYSAIDRANVAIARIPQMPQFSNGTATEKADLNRLLGEAKFLRGFYYFELVRLWGDVPFKTTPSQTGEQLALPLTDRYDIYTQIIKDMQEGGDALPNTLSTDERVNKWAAKAVLARVALYAGGYSLRSDGTMQRPTNYRDFYQLAQTQLNDVINSSLYSLNPNYAQVYKNQSMQVFDAKENLFEASIYTPTITGTNNSSIGYYNAPQTALGVYGSTLFRVFATRTFYNSFKDGDLRRDFAVARYSLDANGNRVGLLGSTQDASWAPGKWSREWQNNSALERTYTNINFVIMRYADVLLMRAEVENELNNGPNTLAYDAINQVTRRAFRANLAGNRVTVTIGSGGSGYVAGTTFVRLTGGGGSDASAVATITSGRISAITMLSNGYGYTSLPTVAITGAGTGATATVSLLPNVPTTSIDLAAGLSKDNFLKAIQDERNWELCFEGIRRADLIRWNLLATKVRDTQTALKAIRANYPYDAATNFVANKHELYPIPQNEMDVNRSIVRQNPGY